MGPVMPFIPLITGVLSAGMGVMGAMQSKKAGEQNAAAIRTQTTEEGRRMEAENERTEARGRAAAAASGTTMQGTPSTFLESLRQENLTELDYFRRTGQQRAGAAKSAGNAAFFEGIGGAAGALGGGLAKTDFDAFGSGTKSSLTRPNQNTWLYGAEQVGG